MKSALILFICKYIHNRIHFSVRMSMISYGNASFAVGFFRGNLLCGSRRLYSQIRLAPCELNSLINLKEKTLAFLSLKTNGTRTFNCVGDQ